MATKKRVLITAGPTWVALDQVRVISNIATGETGFILAEEFKKTRAAVTLLLGPGDFPGKPSGIKIIRFKYFSELEQLLKKELASKKYSALIHSAAVSDYQPEKVIGNKISSQRKSWKINLVPTKKLVDTFKKNQSSLLAVGFKFEPTVKLAELIKKGRSLLKRANLDFVVANSNKNLKYQAYILGNTKQFGPFSNKTKMVACLVKLI